MRLQRHSWRAVGDRQRKFAIATSRVRARRRYTSRPGERSKKNPAEAGFSVLRSLARRPAQLHSLDFVRLQALLALHDLERDLLAFLQRLEAAALDRAEMHEQVRAALRGDEAEALGIVEPLYGSSLTIRHFVTP